MKKTTLALVISVFTATTLFSTLSQAEGPGNGPDRQWQQGGHDNRGNNPHREAPRGADNRNAHNDRGGPDRRASGPQGHPGEREHFAWNGHDFRRGHPMPPRFRGEGYRVNDWRARGLYEPPRDSYWTYVDGNYVLIAAATGVITSILLGSALAH